MKTFEFTKEQYSKLLEICKAVFPRYTIEQSAIPGYICIKEENEKDTIIHILEFCLTHLLTRVEAFIGRRTPKQLMRFYGFYWDMSNYYLHPLDYLYDECKKIYRIREEDGEMFVAGDLVRIDAGSGVSLQDRIDKFEYDELGVMVYFSTGNWNYLKNLKRAEGEIFSKIATDKLDELTNKTQ